MHSCQEAGAKGWGVISEVMAMAVACALSRVGDVPM
jgi:hypothetical protein